MWTKNNSKLNNYQTQEEEGGSQEDEEHTDSGSESEASISKGDKNVTTRKNIQKSNKQFLLNQPYNKIVLEHAC